MKAMMKQLLTLVVTISFLMSSTNAMAQEVTTTAPVVKKVTLRCSDPLVCAQLAAALAPPALTPPAPPIVPTPSPEEDTGISGATVTAFVLAGVGVIAAVIGISIAVRKADRDHGHDVTIVRRPAALLSF
jgi:hypothetical protein